MANAYGLAGGQVLELQNFYRANASLGQTQRQRDATIADLYYLSKQFDGMRDWYDKSVPLRKRKPQMVIPIFRETIEAVDRFLWSGYRFPKAVINPTREEGDDQGADVGPVLGPDDAEQMTKFLAALIRQGRIPQAVREYTTAALKTTSAAVIVGVQAGYLNCYVHSGKDCVPTFDPQNPRDVIELDIKYQHPRDEQIPGSTATKQVWYWYRRVITTMRDIVYREIPVKAGQQIEWIEDTEKTVEHKLGFCPIKWVRTFGDCSDPIDGRPLIDPALYPLLDAISYTVSQRQRAIEYGLDPQPYRKGVAQGEREELRKNPGNVWDLPEQAEVGFLEAQGTGADVASKHLDDLKASFRDAVGVVKANPEINAGTVSGVAMQLLHAPLIALASDLRVDLGDEAYVGLLGLALRVVTTVVQDQGEDVWVPGVKKATATLKAAQLAGPWLDPPITLDWPPFFQETEQDRQFRVQYTNQAVQGGLISAKTGTRQIAEAFSLEDPSAEHDIIDEERDAATKREGSSLMLPPRKPSKQPPLPDDSEKQPKPDEGQGG